jgi:putative transposase
VEHLQQRFCVSERRAFRVVSQPRSSQRYISMKAGKDAALVERMVALSIENPRYGYLQVWALLGREGLGSEQEAGSKAVERGGAQGSGQ